MNVAVSILLVSGTKIMVVELSGVQFGSPGIIRVISKLNESARQIQFEVAVTKTKIAHTKFNCQLILKSNLKLLFYKQIKDTF